MAIKLVPPLVRVNWMKSWGIQKFLDVNGKWNILLKAMTQGFGKENTLGSMASLYAGLGLFGHNGYDISTIGGDPIIASHDGVVQWAGADSSGGIGVVLWNKENTYKTIYWHNSSNTVKTGDKIKQGELLAFSDSTGLSTGTHLHFGLKITDAYGSTINNSNGYRGAIDPTPHLIDKNMLKLVIYKGEQYLRNSQGMDTHIVGAYSLKYLKRLDVINEAPEEVDSINLGDDPVENTFIPYVNE